MLKYDTIKIVQKEKRIMNQRLTTKDIVKMMGNEEVEDREHTDLSASWAKIWLHCTQATALAKQFPDVESTEDFTIEGNRAHYIGELLLTKKLKVEQIPLDFDLVETYYNKAMEIKGDGNLLVEVKVDMTEMLESHTPIMGRSDFVVLQRDGSIDIGDLKYGMGVRVDAHKNEQLMLYAIGTLHWLSDMGLLDLDDIDLTTRVTLHIIQPRLDISYSYYNTTIGDLLNFGEFVKRQLKKIKNGDLCFEKGAHCQFCKGKTFCPLFAETTNIVVQDAKKELTSISPEKILELYSMKADVMAFYRAMDKYIKAQITLSENGEFAGYKIVTKEGAREVVDEEALMAQFKAVGCSEDELRVAKIVGISTIDKLAKQYGINKADIAGVAKKISESVESVIDPTDSIFKEVK